MEKLKRYLSPEKKWQKVMGAAFIILITGIILNVYVYTTDCKRAIDKCIKEYVKDKRTALYIINDAHIECRPCFKYDELSRDGNIDIYFLVRKDFSDNDIENFKDTFGISDEHSIERIDNEWEKINKKCNSGNNILYNLLIFIDEDGEVEEIRKF